ncbi:unnamed protein product [Ectocarpus sp. 12 AP-2014]
MCCEVFPCFRVLKRTSIEMALIFRGHVYSGWFHLHTLVYFRSSLLTMERVGQSWTILSTFEGARADNVTSFETEGNIDKNNKVPSRRNFRIILGSRILQNWV